jgi:protein-S-isoprenylcysteine O-methyltransferase Ste14
VDLGKVVATAIFASLAALNGVALWDGLTDEEGMGALELVSTTLTLAFYVMLVLAYLRRGEASASDHSVVAWAAALAATASPFLIPIVRSGGRDEGTAAAVVAIVVMLGGLVAMVWALAALGTSISVIPQARAVVTDGPYRWVRHPLYTAELVTIVGLGLTNGGFWPWGVVACQFGLQYVRARREETLLAQVLDGYADYQQRVPMLVPGLRPTGQ